MAVRGTPRNYYDAYAFLVEIDGIVKAAFNKCSGLKASAEPIEIHEGGELTAHKSLGLVEFEPIELEYGETDNKELWLWWKQAFNAASGKGSGDENEYKRQITVKQMNRARALVRQWNVFDCLPSGYEAGDWDGDSNEHHIMKFIIGHHGFDDVAV